MPHALALHRARQRDVRVEDGSTGGFRSAKYFTCMDRLQIFVEEKLQTVILILHGYWVTFITSIFIFITQTSTSTRRRGFWKNNPLSIISYSEAWI